MRYGLNGVDDRAKTMPANWAGHKKVERIIVFHDAYKAGPHIEWYLVVNGQAHNMGVKRLNAERLERIGYDKRGFYNNNGDLSQKARRSLLEVVQEEFDGEGLGSFVGQSTDHMPDEARESWRVGERLTDQSSYGAGKARIVLADDKVEVWKLGETIEGRDPLISNNKDFYIHKFKETENGNVVLKIGLKSHGDPDFPDRLHLKPYIGEETYDKFVRDVGNDGIVTLKEDGASFYFQITKHGFRAWSPRRSVETNERIQYTHKLGGVRHLTSDKPIEGMGEITFVDKRTGKILHSHEIGGLLNRKTPLDDHYEPRLVIYRIDQVGRKSVIDEPYERNLERIDNLVRDLDDPRVHTPEIVGWADAYHTSQKYEGLVGIPKGSSIGEALKYKPRGNLHDWPVTAVDLHYGPKGRIAGVVRFQREDGKPAKIGASSMGTDEEVLDIMNNPDKYVGRVARVESYKGHEGRAAKFVDWHQDKGLG